MIRGPFQGIYLRPGNLEKNFTVHKITHSKVSGRPISTYERNGNLVTGILAEADAYQNDKMKHRWDQDQRSCTHTLIVTGGCSLIKGDFLTLDSRAFLVLLTDDVAALNGTTIVYLEERNDLR